MWTVPSHQERPSLPSPPAALPNSLEKRTKYLTSLKIQSLGRVFCEVAVKSSQWCLQDFSAWAVGRPADE